MAVVIRYFAVTGAGAADGTTHANRATLFTGGAWSSVITGFDFSGTDGMEARIEAGTYAITAALTSGLFSHAPTAANPLIMIGADSSAGNVLPVPNPKWRSCEPAWDASGLPQLNTTSNISTINLSTVHLCLLAFGATARSGVILQTAASITWCSASNTNSNSSTSVSSVSGTTYGCVFSINAAIYDTILSGGPLNISNTRLEGVTGSSGNRRGLTIGSGAITNMDLVTVVNNGGEGIISTSSNAATAILLSNSVIANNGSDGFKVNSTAAQTGYSVLANCMITGSGGIGINGNSAAGRIVVAQCRTRNNSGGDTSGLGNYPIDLNLFTTSGTDADEYISTGANGNFTLRYGGLVWSGGYGVNIQCASSGGGLRIAGHGGLAA